MDQAIEVGGIRYENRAGGWHRDNMLVPRREWPALTAAWREKADRAPSMEAANRLLALGAPRLAAQLLAREHDRVPRDVRVICRYAKALLKIGAVELALEVTRRSAALPARRMQALALAQSGRFREARALLTACFDGSRVWYAVLRLVLREQVEHHEAVALAP